MSKSRKSNLPKISIVVPSLNKVDFIDKTLDSIVSQEYPNLQVIIQDGGSTDGTLEIIKKYAKRYSGFISWDSRKDKGQVDAINNGLIKAKGQILTYINADDVYKMGALNKVGEYFTKNPKALWVAGKGDMIDERGKEISPWITSYKNFLLTINYYPLLLIVNYLMQPSVFLSRKAFEKYGPFIGTEIGVIEYDLWLKIGKVKMPKVLDKTLSSFRIYKGSISTKEFKKVLLADEQIAKKYTQNPLILLLHYMHNVGRVAVLNLVGI